jgi:hypothetical protein
VPLYRNGKIVGALGVSGDTSCADHEIAKRVRDIANLNPPAGRWLMTCLLRTRCTVSFRTPGMPEYLPNGTKIGNEAPATYPFVPPRRNKLNIHSRFGVLHGLVVFE